MPRFLPLRANVEWLKKTAKERLRALRAAGSESQLSDVQSELAREYGFASWRKMIAHIEEVRDKLRILIPDEPSGADDSQPVAPDDADVTALFNAIESGDNSRVLELLHRRRALVHARDGSGRTPLHAAAQCNDAQAAIALLACGADPELTYGDSAHTALSWAMTCNAPDFARALVRLGVSADLFEAAGLGMLEEVRACFDDSGALREGAVRRGSSRFDSAGRRLPCPPLTAVEQVSDALCSAGRNGHAEVVRDLLSRPCDLNFRGFMGATPLHWACFGGSEAAVNLLRAAGADDRLRDHVLHCTPRLFAIAAPASWGLLFLVRKHALRDPVLIRLHDGRTIALHEAARAGRTAVVAWLLEQGADGDAVDADGKTAEDLAAFGGHEDVVKALRGD